MHTTTGTLESTPSSPSISLADFDYDSDTPVDLPSTQEADSSVPLGLEPTIALDRGCLISSSRVTQSDMASLRSMIQHEFDLLRQRLLALNHPVPATPPVTVPTEVFTDSLRAELALQMAKVSVLEEETRNLRAEKQALRTKLEQTGDAGGLRAELDAANAERQSLYVERQGLWDERAGLWRERQTLWDERADLWKERGHLWEERGELWVVRDRLTEQVQNLISAKSGGSGE